MTKENEPKCWICKKDEKEIEEFLESIDEMDGLDGYGPFSELRPEDIMDDKFHKHPFHICFICWRLLNSFIDRRHDCLHDID